jgi:hypothetical protein
MVRVHRTWRQVHTHHILSMFVHLRNVQDPDVEHIDVDY